MACWQIHDRSFGQSINAKIVVSTMPKKDLMILLTAWKVSKYGFFSGPHFPAFGLNTERYGVCTTFEKLSLQIRTRINHVIKNKLPYCNLQIVFQIKCRLIHFLAFKDKIPAFLRPAIVYKFKCGGCNATCYSKTTRYVKSRMCQLLGFYGLTRKRSKSDEDSSAICEHHLLWNHLSIFNDLTLKLH